MDGDNLRPHSKIARLALVALNAVRNGDFHRAIEIIEGLHDLCAGGQSTDERDVQDPPGGRELW
jgi:hypothetical protein